MLHTRFQTAPHMTARVANAAFPPASWMKRSDLLRLVSRVLGLLLEQLFRRGIRKVQLDRQLIQRAGEPERHSKVPLMKTTAAPNRAVLHSLL